MSLVEIAAVDVESSCLVSLFVHCHRIISSCNPSLPTSPVSTSLHIQIVDPPMLYEANVAPCHKPQVLDCSDVEYVAAIESALLSSHFDASIRRLDLRWCKRKRILTLMERTSVAMKFCTIEFHATSESPEAWRHLLHQVTTRQRDMEKSIADTESSVQQMEVLVRRKEALLETALVAKQKVEDQFVQNFCALLNAKKDEIKRLQLELLAGKGMHIENTKTLTGKRNLTLARKKATGAKLQRKREDEKEKEHSSESSEGKFTALDAGGYEKEQVGKNRLKDNAIKAYSALPPISRSGSVEMKAGEELLSSMDANIDSEEEKNDDALQVQEFSGDNAIMPDLGATQVPLQVMNRTEKQADEAIDSLDEDMYDML
uniref:Uncharacterized protein n=1 Tax=Peronospora matthiolae TaxID=2874970 RepID=A0AAV1TA83_9STRA